MFWKTKSKLQKIIALLPSSLLDRVYYIVQRHTGRLRTITPVARFYTGIDMWRRITDLGQNPREKVFFELGTGRVPLLPLAYWLMGARKTITIDHNHCLKPDLMRECLLYMLENTTDIEALFGLFLVKKRLYDLIEFSQNISFDINTFLELCHITYRAPADAAQTGLNDRSVDYYTSNYVLEHITPQTLMTLLEEGNRIIAEDGLFIHRIDYSDHFSHSDNSLSRINFLQFTDSEWAYYAGNRFAYVNRLRHDDFLAMFHAADHQVVSDEPHSDERTCQLLKSGNLQLDNRFQSKSREILAITDSWITTKKLTE